MTNKKVEKSSGGISLVTGISGIYAYATVPSFTGVKGAFAAAMTGMGTSLASGVYALGGGAVGAIGGGALGSLAGRSKEGAVIGGLVAGLGSAAYGIVDGYGHAKDIMVNGMKEDNVKEVIGPVKKSNLVFDEDNNPYFLVDSTEEADFSGVSKPQEELSL